MAGWSDFQASGSRAPGADGVVRSQSRTPRRQILIEGDPLPPEDCLPTDAAWRSDVETLYRERATQLIGHFLSRSHDRDMASDIVHEAFARFAALKIGRRLMIGRPDAYLYRMCINLVRDRRRADQARERHGQAQDYASSQHCPYAELEHRDTLRRLERAMLRLKPKTREIFLAKRLDGMSYAEIAERTGLSVKGVEKHMSKAIAVIDRAMDRDRA